MTTLLGLKEGARVALVSRWDGGAQFSDGRFPYENGGLQAEPWTNQHDLMPRGRVVQSVAATGKKGNDG